MISGLAVLESRQAIEPRASRLSAEAFQEKLEMAIAQERARQ